VSDSAQILAKSYGVGTPYAGLVVDQLVDAGADAIFPEALRDLAEFVAVREAVDVPLLANMTEFGKSELLTARQLSDVGYNAVIYPVTTLRIAMGAVEAGLRELATAGTQLGLLDGMQHRSRLYELLRYADYNDFDSELFTFRLPGETTTETIS